MQAEFVALLDSYLADELLTPLDRAQLTIHRRWVVSTDSNVPELQCIFAALPGLAGVPLPDGRMTMWNPIAHLVCNAAGFFVCGSAEWSLPPQRPTSRGSVVRRL